MRVDLEDYLQDAVLDHPSPEDWSIDALVRMFHAVGLGVHAENFMDRGIDGKVGRILP
jgi:hypothetical protein